MQDPHDASYRDAAPHEDDDLAVILCNAFLDIWQSCQQSISDARLSERQPGTTIGFRTLPRLYPQSQRQTVCSLYRRFNGAD